jgi:hypothetical protein
MQLETAANHFGHRENVGVGVDLFWGRSGLEDEFRVEVLYRLMGVRFLLYPRSGREAMHAFYHPFAAAAAPDVRGR